MTSVVFLIVLLLQTIGGVRTVNGRVSIEGGAQAPSSFALTLTPIGDAPLAAQRGAASPSLIIRPQVDGTFRLQMRPGEYRVGAPNRLPPGYTLQSMMHGEVNLLRDPLKISSDASAELT